METDATTDVQVEQLPTGNDKTSVTNAYIIETSIFYTVKAAAAMETGDTPDARLEQQPTGNDKMFF